MLLLLASIPRRDMFTARPRNRLKYSPNHKYKQARNTNCDTNKKQGNVVGRCGCSFFVDPRLPAPAIVSPWDRARYMSGSEDDTTLWGEGEGEGEGGGGREEGGAVGDDVKLLWYESGLVFGGKVRGCLGVEYGGGGLSMVPVCAT